MKYVFPHKITDDWSFEESKVIADATTFINSPIAGNPVIEIGRYLSKVTGVKYLLIGRFVGEGNQKVETICFFNREQLLDNITYDLRNTPCNGVINQNVCYYPYGVQEEFPEDADLVIMGVNSYMGTALQDYAGNAIGLVVLLHDQTIENPGLIDHLLTLFSPKLEKHLAT